MPQTCGEEMPLAPPEKENEIYLVKQKFEIWP
jgi:hypothetical protein